MPTARHVLSLDIGSNSVGSMWFDRKNGKIVTGTSVFPAGVDESDDKRGEPKNAKRRMSRRTRITLARRAQRKRELRLKLIESGLLPRTEAEFVHLLQTTDPWELRRKGLSERLSPMEFGRVLLHLAQRRGALGLKIAEVEAKDDDDVEEAAAEDGKIKAAIGEVRAKMLACKARTFGEFMAMQRDQRVHALPGKDPRPAIDRKGRREYRDAIRNKAGSYEHCADRAMIRDEFAHLWKAQKKLGGSTAAILTDTLRTALDDESGDSTWRHRGLLFGQRRQSWDLGTLGRCVLEPTERCAPHADMHASRYLVVETVNNLKVIERGKEPRAVTPAEREKIKAFLSGPLGVIQKGKYKGQAKRGMSVTDLRELMGWGRASKTAQFRFNIEADEERAINTDWFSREIIHGAVTMERWTAMPDNVREGLNRAILSHDPEQDGHAERLYEGVMKWGGLNTTQAEALVQAWKGRPNIEAKRLNMSRRAVRNLLTVMDRSEPWPDPARPGQHRWLTQIEARKLIASDSEFIDVTTGQKLDDHARRRYATGAKGLSARDRHYLRKHAGDLPPAPMLTNPVVRKAIHEVRRHLVEYMRTFGCKPDEIYVELAREAAMGAKASDALLLRNRLRSRIRSDIVDHFKLDSRTPTQQRAAVDRVVLCVQQGQICPLCGKGGLTEKKAAEGNECEVAHIIPRGSGGHNGLGNLVLAHTRCNREMARRTPRQYWSDTLAGGFEQGMSIIEKIYGEVHRPSPSEWKSAKGVPLWSLYFVGRPGRLSPTFDQMKIDQFKKDVKDIQEMTNRQDAATKYAARQVMAYLADALYEGKGLPERGGNRSIYATDGLWTSRLRREWGLFFDPHHAKGKGLSNEEEQQRKEKNRGDHRHHAIDAIVIGLCTHQVRNAWEAREKAADLSGVNTADEEAMENYRRRNPLPPPHPYKSREQFREAVQAAVFGDEKQAKPIAHRPVKRKLTGALHEETLFGPVLDEAGQLTGNYTAKKGVLSLTPNHLRMPDGWDEIEIKLRDGRTSESRKRDIKRELAAMIDPPPGKSGIVRDRALRNQIRRCLRLAKIDPDRFSAGDIKKLVTSGGGLRHDSGVPIRSVVLLRTMSDPVIIDRRVPEYASNQMNPDTDPASRRAYVGGNNHHIEIRAAKNKKGEEVWSGEIVSAFTAAQRKLAKLRALRAAKIPRPTQFRELSPAERKRLKPLLRQIENAHPLVNRNDDDTKGGAFVMSLCEGEMLHMRHKDTGEVGYFVVAKLDKPQSIVLVPHWDARAAGERKDAEGKVVPESARDQFSATPGDLRRLAPPGKPHAVKVRVSPLGVVTELERD